MKTAEGYNEGIPGVDYPLEVSLVNIGEHSIGVREYFLLEGQLRKRGSLEVTRDLLANGMSTTDVQILLAWIG